LSLKATQILVLAIAACRRQTEPDLPLMRIVSHDYGYEMPARMPAGLVHVRLVNQGPDIHEAMVIRFTGAGSAAGYVDSVRADVDFPAFGEDMGGAGLAAPGDSTDVYLHLAPGRYAIVCWKGDHLSRGMARDFVVVADSTTAGAGRGPAPDPHADLSIIMTEYSYQLSGPVSAGRHLIRVENRGAQPHEADLIRLGPGKTPHDYIAWLDGGEQGLPPAEVAGGVGDFVAGRTVWMDVTLPPGHYFIICQVPDAGDGKPHYDHGMIREFEVR
jgi:uncharacterized cupredoxin-like copper-binding protein